MGPKKPEIEYISLKKLAIQKQLGQTKETKVAFDSLKRLADTSLKSGPFSITFDKKLSHIAPSNDKRDFLSYAPYWWPENPDDPNTRYIRKDGKRNPDIRMVKDQMQLELLAENMTYLCLGYYFFQDENYATHATSLLDTFFLNEETRMNPNLNYAQYVRGCQNKTRMGRGEGVISSRGLSRIVNMLPLIDTFHGYYALKQFIQVWFGTYLNWLKYDPIALEASKSKNNINTWYHVQLISFQQFLHQNSHDIILNFLTRILPNQIDKSTGNQPLESKRANPFHYLSFNMQAIIFIVKMAKEIGLEYNTNLIHLSINYMTKFSNDPNLDLTQAIRSIEVASIEKIIDDSDNCCKQFIGFTYHHCKFIDNIKGPKHILHLLWSF